MRTEMQIVLLVTVYIIQPIVSQVYSETDQLAILRVCEECTFRESKNLSLSPTCLRCFCDLDCLYYGDCCIDVLIQNNLHTRRIDHGLTCFSPTVDGFQPRNSKIIKTKDQSLTNITNINDLVPDDDYDDDDDEYDYYYGYDYTVKNTDKKTVDAEFTYQDIKLLPGSDFGYYMRTHFRYMYGDVLCDKTFIPVTCNNDITYINIGCAVLDKSADCVHWTIESVKNPPNHDTEYYFIPPASAKVRLCDSHRSSPIISTCSPEYSNLSSLCSKYFSLVVDVVGKVYRNMFCYECNGGEFETLEERLINPLISLTKFTPDFKEETIICNGMTSWFDSNSRKCRPIKCHGDKILEDGLCVSNNKTALGTKYHLVLQLKLYTTHLVSNINQIIGHMMFQFQAKLSSISFQIEASYQIKFLDYSLVLLHVWFEVTEDIRLTYVEHKLMFIGRAVENFGFNVILTVNTYELNQTDHHVFRYFKSERKTRLCCSVEKTRHISSELDFELVTNELTCSYIEFEQSEYKFVKGSAFIKHFNLTLVQGYFSITKNKLSVCFDIILSMTNSVRTNETLYISDNSNSFDVSLWYVTITCVSFSMISLVIIIMTYTVFNELRTQPGINNLILCWNLFMAQLMLMVGFDRMKQVTLCKIIGIFTHFFSLNTLFWMNICSYHMFKVFVVGKFVISASRATVKQSMIYCIYGYGCPVLIVSVTIITNIILSDGKKLGFGGDICYLSSTLLVLYSFVIPLCLVIISNVIFFILTVITIHRVKPEGKQTGERNNVYIYLKLSVVTGVFWTVSLMTNFFDFFILEYMAVFLNGSQGVFLLWSLIINKKVLKKYRAVFCQCITDVQSETSNMKK